MGIDTIYEHKIPETSRKLLEAGLGQKLYDIAP